MLSGILEEMTIDEVRQLDPQVAVLAVTSTEPHGPHLPYGTDLFIGDGISRRAVKLANERGGRVVMLPSLPIGNNVNFKAWPLACRLRVRTLMHVLLDIIEALEEDGLRKIVLVNAHGGNTDTLRAVLREHIDRQPADWNRRRSFCCMIGATTFARKTKPTVAQSPHAGEYETVCMMHLHPDLVRKDKLTDMPIRRPAVEALADPNVAYVTPWHALLPMSGGGDTRGATPQKGKAIVEEAVDGMADFLVELSQAPWSATFPFAQEKDGKAEG